MDPRSPYAPPSSDVAGPTLLEADVGPGPWRHGRLLVVRKDGDLPPVCLKSGAPAETELERRLSWHHPAWYFVIFVNVLLYAIVAVAVRRTARLRIGLSRAWARRRRRRIAITLATFLGSIGALVLAAEGVPNGADWMGVFLPVGSLGCLASIVYGFTAPRLVHPRLISREYVWLKGVDRAWLETLPEWPHGLREPKRAA